MKPSKHADKTPDPLTVALGLSEENSDPLRLMRETLEADLAEEYDDTDSQVLLPASGIRKPSGV